MDKLRDEIADAVRANANCSAEAAHDAADAILAKLREHFGSEEMVRVAADAIADERKVSENWPEDAARACINALLPPEGARSLLTEDRGLGE